MKTVIITGGDGFIGTHLTKYLIEYGYEVWAIVIKGSQSRSRIDGIENVHVVEADINKYQDALKFLPPKPHCFFHFAWAGVTPNQRSDFVFQMQNIELSINAVRLAADIGAEKFIFPGSTMEYSYYGKPIDKKAVPSPLNAYGVAKISARYACQILCKEMNVNYLYTVISSIYSEDRNDNNVIYYTIDKLLNGEKPSLTKLEQRWDYVHIDDVVYALRLIAESGKKNTFYSIGHGDNCPLSNYILQIRDAIDSNLPLGIGDIPYSNNEILSSCVNLQSIFEDTGFIPKIPFNEGIARVIAEVRRRRQSG